MGNLGTPQSIASSQNMDLGKNLADSTSRCFSENMGYPELMKIVVIKKCPKLLKIYGMYV